MHPTPILATFSNIPGRPKDISKRGKTKLEEVDQVKPLRSVCHIISTFILLMLIHYRTPPK